MLSDMNLFVKLYKLKLRPQRPERTAYGSTTSIPGQMRSKSSRSMPQAMDNTVSGLKSSATGKTLRISRPEGLLRLDRPTIASSPLISSNSYVRGSPGCATAWPTLRPFFRASFCARLTASSIVSALVMKTSP